MRRAQLRGGGGLQQLTCSHALHQDVSATASPPRVSGVGACDGYLQAAGCKQAVMHDQMTAGISRKMGVKLSNL